MRSFLVATRLVAFLLCSQTSQAAQLTTTTWPLGQPNLTAAEGNPLKGFMPSPDWTAPPYLQSVPSSLEYYYLQLNELMNTSLSDFGGIDAYLEPRLAGSAARARHAVIRVVIDYPTFPTGVPHFLVADGLAFNTYSEYGGGQSPDYSSEPLLQALEAFIAHLGARYDGDPRLAFIQVGLLGFWGEWHTYPHSTWLPAEAKNRVVAAFKAAFSVTQLNVRVPWPTAISEPRFGLHDDSFAYSTVDGAANGGVSTPWFFWPSVVAAGGSENWKHGATGGELRPGLQSTIFDSTYPAGTEYKQDFQTCVETTHATYLVNSWAFNGAGYSGSALEAARNGSMRMGYNYVVPSVGAAHDAASPGFIDVTLTVQNIGVAPFYYGLNVTLACNDNDDATQESWAGVLEGVENLLPGQSSDFNFTKVPAHTTSCVVSLASKHVYLERPVRFAHNLQSFTLSLPPTPAPPVPTLPPTPTTTGGSPAASPSPSPPGGAGGGSGSTTASTAATFAAASAATAAAATSGATTTGAATSTGTATGAATTSTAAVATTTSAAASSATQSDGGFFSASGTTSGAASPYQGAVLGVLSMLLLTALVV